MEVIEKTLDPSSHTMSAADDGFRRKLSVNESETTNHVEEEFACSVCLRLAVDPTTLLCGHTTCRLCLVRWYFNSTKKECPLCRQIYNGHPKINTQIRNMLQKLASEKYQEREAEIKSDPENQKLVEMFDKKLSSESNNTKDKTDMSSFCNGLIVATFAFIALYLAWYWRSSENNLLVHKPVITWKNKDVVSWLEQMSWSVEYIQFAKEKNIDGIMLLSLNKDSLGDLFNITDPVHERALLYSIDRLRENDTKFPATLWEFKALYPGRCLFLTYGMKDFPRTTFLYIYIYFYDDLLLPFIHKSTLDVDESLNSTHILLEDPRYTQWIKFALYAFIVPRWLPVSFAWQYSNIHFFTPIFILIISFINTFVEAMTVLAVLRHKNYRLMRSEISIYFKQLISAFMFMVLWPLIPSFVCDVFFYGALYISPIQGGIELFKKYYRL